MQISIKGKNLEVTDRLKTYIEKKVTKLDRFMPNIDEARIELTVQETKSAGDRHVAQITLRDGRAILRAEERSGDMQMSIDAVLEKMSRQIERYKGKHWRSHNRQAEQPEVAVEEVEAESDVVRIKRFQTRPMNVDEAVEQMEMLGHDFFVFFDAATNAFNVVYRRRDGGYGLLIPELA
jgi:putative sigma-54 modulation protein